MDEQQDISELTSATIQREIGEILRQIPPLVAEERSEILEILH